MLRITKVSVPVAMAALIFTGQAQENASQPARPSVSKETAEQSARKDSQLSQDQRNQQSTFQPGQISDSQLKKTVTDVNKASAFIGMAVKNTQNDSMGKVHDLVFDPESGRISYAVISVGGMLGVGDKLIAIPIASLKRQPGQKYLVLNMDKSQVQSAPGLAQNSWPDLDSPGIGAPAGSESATSGPTSSATRPESSTAAPSSGNRPQSGTSSQTDASKARTSPSVGSNSDASAATQAPSSAKPDSPTSKSDSQPK